MSRRTGYASLPLHGGRAPAWLFSRMVRLSREIVVYLTSEYGAVKEGIRDLDAGLGFFAAGGKGNASRKTPDEIARACDRLGADPRPLVYASRTAAKVDSAAVQDGYQLYHHVFFFTAAGAGRSCSRA